MSFPLTATQIEQALTVPCVLCKAKPGVDCTNTLHPDKPLGRPIHLYRMDQVIKAVKEGRNDLLA